MEGDCGYRYGLGPDPDPDKRQLKTTCLEELNVFLVGWTFLPDLNMEISEEISTVAFLKQKKNNFFTIGHRRSFLVRKKSRSGPGLKNSDP